MKSTGNQPRNAKRPKGSNGPRREGTGINLKRFFALLGCAALFAGCNKEEYDPDAQPSLAISPTMETLTFSAEATEIYTFEVTTNQPVWLPITDQDWCKVTMTPSTNTFTVTALPNSADTPPAPATITVTAGKAAPLTITATQAPASGPMLAISPAMESITFSAEANESYTFEVMTNQPDWQPVADQDWCKITKDATKNAFTVTALPNDASTPPAPATITVTAGKAAPLTITATQEPAAEPTLAISPAMESITFSAEANESYTFEVTTNQPDWQPVADQEWCKITKDATKNAFTVTALPNGASTPPPAAKITVTAGKAAPLTITATQAASTEYVLYLSGYYQTDNGSRACYWRNGTRVDLPPVDESPMGETRAMTVSNGSVYIVGRGEMSGCYWKDGGAPTKLSEYYDTRSIAVDNETVYVLGGNYFVWKNGVLQDSNWAKDFTPYALTVLNGTLYAAGRLHLEVPMLGYSADVAACGKPGSPRQLSSPIVSNDTDAYCVTASAGSFYVGGYYYDEDAKLRRACFWKDSQKATPLEVPKGDSEVRFICVENGTVYTAGHYFDGEQDVHCYWVNEKCTKLQLPAGAKYSEVTGIAVAGGTVYVCGTCQDENYIAQACYWIDGKLTILPETPDSFGQHASGIAMVRN